MNICQNIVIEASGRWREQEAEITLVLFWDALLSFPHLLLYTLAGLSLAGATRADSEY
jgi:hypothetical protein